MKNSNITIVVPGFNPQDADSIAIVLSALAASNHKQWSDTRVLRSFDRTGDDETELRVSLDFVYATKPWRDGEYGEKKNERVITLDQLEATIQEVWGELFETYNVIGTGAGDHWDGVSAKAKELAANGKNSIFDFNGITHIVSATTNLEHLYRDYCNSRYLETDTIGSDRVIEYDEALTAKIQDAKDKSQREHEAYMAEAAKEEEAKRQSILDRIKNVEMVVSNPTLWNEYKEKNTDSYGGRCVSYAEEWARLMQYELAKVTKGFQWTETALISAFSTIAERTSREADYDGITGFMYGCAVNMLSQCWEKGEMLRKWHNKEYGHEGDGVVNPAVLTVAVG